MVEEGGRVIFILAGDNTEVFFSWIEYYPDSAIAYVIALVRSYSLTTSRIRIDIATFYNHSCLANPAFAAVPLAPSPQPSTSLPFPTVFISTMTFSVGNEDAPTHRQRAEGDRQTRYDRGYVEETYI
jgi:hypothetical protein